MSIEEIQKTIADQKKQIDRIADGLKSAPDDVRTRQEKILKLVKEELANVEKELDKYADYKF